MARNSSAHITRLLKAWCGGDRTALDQLTPAVYSELHRVARQYLSRERQGHTLQPTALVNEAYVRLIDAASVNWHDRAHFFAISSQIMRRILVDAARARAAEKRGGQVERINIDKLPELGWAREDELIALEDSLATLAKIDGRKVKVVELRFFGGLSVEETAQVLGISPQSVMRDWRFAKVWLQREIERKY